MIRQRGLSLIATSTQEIKGVLIIVADYPLATDSYLAYCHEGGITLLI